jgi:hypothetical protein
VWAGGSRDGLLANWERFALPLVEARAAGGGTLPAADSLLRLDGRVELSNVRRRGGDVEVCVWNAREDATASTLVGGRRVEVGPARISRVRRDAYADEASPGGEP